MYIIVGLGNPGTEYEATRHNVGFMVIDRLSKEYGIRLDRKSRLARWGEGTLAGENVVLLKPLTFMNNSGLAVREILKGKDVELDHLIVVYDDLDLEPGRIRIRPDGGSGGHKGIQSLVGQLGSGDFLRVRIGIGRPSGRQDASDYVLKPFAKREREEIEFAIIKATDAITSIIQHGVERAMNEFNRKEEAEA
ncbi:MAG: aminoacyl-tRNA hydrolase [Candidatus Aquicultor sp.]